MGYVKKQGDMKEKPLTLDCVLAVKKYIETSGLSPDDYFVGAADKWGNYKNRMITERSYSRLIHDYIRCGKRKLPICIEKTQT